MRGLTQLQLFSESQLMTRRVVEKMLEILVEKTQRQMSHQERYCGVNEFSWIPEPGLLLSHVETTPGVHMAQNKPRMLMKQNTG